MAFKLLNHNIIFIHIPKAGGSSIYNAFKLANSCILIPTGYAHTSITELENNYKINADTYITQCRHPFKRFYSHYNYLLEWNEKRIKGLLPLKSKPIKYYIKMNQFLYEKKFIGFVELLNDKSKINDFIYNFPTEISAFQKQVDFLNLKRNLKIFKLENGLIWKYFSELGYKITPMHSKKSVYKNIKINNEIIDILYKYFFEDYSYFNYDKNLNN